MSINKYIASLGSFSNKKVVLIGGTSGIGLELLKHLTNLKVPVILLGIEKDLLPQLKEQYGLVDTIYYDQSSNVSIDKAIDELINKHKDFTTIVLNAGVLGVSKVMDNGYPGTIAINYIGNRYFIDKISPKLNQKVKFVIAGSFAAGLHFKKKHDLKDPNLSTFDQYNLSKAYLEAYFYKISKEHKYPSLDYVCVEPGLVNTGIIHNFNKVIRFLGKYFLKWFFHSPSKASLGLLTGISDKSKNGNFIVPRGLFNLSGYPKINNLPIKRRRPQLFD